ncbi:GTP-binding protein [uncultured Muribaculum sp.]|uniref:GTP-binding protein n=1 Tax=uncultured Muribaculum sp. TaxID=1918613 RepID=UPI0025F4017C|nr:GTP-binding protein [uncultured Muribaculum sp.]
MSTKKEQTPVLLLTGYLGSGKTTLVNHILSNERGIRFAVIVNDIGEVNIDASLIQKGGVVDTADDSLVALQNGCICCTLKMDLVKQIEDIIALHRFDYIVIEASGICEPAPIAQTICSIPYMGAEYGQNGIPRLDCIVTVVDALRLQSEFDCGRDLTKKDIDDEDIENLVIQQIEFCNIILLNKASEVASDQLKRIREIVRVIQPKAEIIDTDYADVDIARLLDTHLFNFEKVATSAGWVRELERPVSEEEELEAQADHHNHHEEHHHDHDDDHHDHDGDYDHDGHRHHDEEEHGHHHHNHHHHDGEGEAEEYGIQTFVYYRRDPFGLNRFDYFLDKKWPRNVVRTKGVLYFEQRPEMSYLFEQAGIQKKLTEAGQWYATAPEDDLMMLMQQNPDMMRDWHEHYGDRMVKLVFIGQHLDREAITRELDACLGRF